MRVAMILRPDADRVFGGDTVVMERLSAALRELGVDVVVGRQDEMPPAREFDLAHLFGVTPPDHARRMVAWAGDGGAAIVFSPLYYNDFRGWFSWATVRVPRWVSMARIAGRERAWRMYRTWQTARLPVQKSWRTMRAALLAADSIATTSIWENGFVADHFRLPARVRARMRLGRFGVDTGLYGQKYSEEELAAFRDRHGLARSYIVEVARIESKKNQLGLIEAMWNDPVDLVFVGSGSPHFEPDYAERCREASLRRGRVHFLGWLTKSQLPLMYAAAGAHALPSWFELPGLSSLEAGACGTRIVSTQISPLPEMLAGQASYCDPFDAGSIRTAVVSALDNPVPAGLRERLLTEYSWGEAARVNLQLYEDVLRARAASPAGPRGGEDGKKP